MKIHELLSSPERWCKRAMARDANGSAVLYNSPHAVAWCLEGARQFCYSDPGEQHLIWDKLCAGLGPNANIMCFNDAWDTTHAMVHALALKTDS